MRIFSVIGSPTPTDTGPASYCASVKSPTAPLKEGGAPLVGTGKTLITVVSLLTMTRRWPPVHPRNIRCPEETTTLQVAGPRVWAPSRVAVTGTRKLSQL